MKSIVLALMLTIGMTTTTTRGTTVSVAARINPLQCVGVTDRSGRLVNGCYEVTRFVNINGRVWALCKLRGILDGVDIEEDCQVPVTIGDCSGGGPLANGEKRECCVKVSFGSCSTGPLLLRVDIDPTDVTCTTADYAGDILCLINTACRTIGTPCDQIVMLCNQLL